MGRKEGFKHREEERMIKNARLNTEFIPDTKDFYEFLRNIIYIILDSNIIEIINKECDLYESDNELLGSLYLENQNIIVKWAYINALLKHLK